jgi:hypothetical protein
MNQGQAAQAQPGGGVAKIRYGVYDQQVPAGNNLNVGAIRSNYQTMWSMPKDADAYINGEKKADDYVIQPGDQVEFHRRAGEKG